MKKTNREEEQPMPFELLRAGDTYTEHIFVKPSWLLPKIDMAKY